MPKKDVKLKHFDFPRNSKYGKYPLKVAKGPKQLSPDIAIAVLETSIKNQHGDPQAIDINWVVVAKPNFKKAKKYWASRKIWQESDNAFKAARKGKDLDLKKHEKGDPLPTPKMSFKFVIREDNHPAIDGVIKEQKRTGKQSKRRPRFK